MLFDADHIPAFESAVLSANCGGIKAETKAGRPARLAIVDENGNVLESGADVEKAAWVLMRLAFLNFLEGKGHVRISRQQ